MKDYMDALLMNALGKRELVENWWSSPNWTFDMNTPAEMWQKEQDKVVDYLLQMLCGGYGNGE